MAKVLIVDDEPSILSFIGTLLTREKHDVDTAMGGEEALGLVKENDYDLLITDYVMHPMNGMDLLCASKEVRPDLAVILISGLATVETAVEAMKYGAFDCLAKPVKVRVLREIVRNALAVQEVEGLKNVEKPGL